MSIRLYNLEFNYKDQTVITDLSLEIADGGILCVMGESGCGKTTLLGILTGRLKPKNGEIQGISGKRIGMVFQENRLLEEFSAESNILLGCDRGFYPFDGGDSRHWKKAEKRKHIDEHLRMVGLEEASKEKVKNLSGGMKRRVAIVRAMMSDCDILVMDEPFQGLDEKNRRKAIAYIRQYKGERTLLLVTHEKEDAQRLGGVLFQMS